MGDYVTVASVRRTSGILVGEISDDDVNAIITEVEPQVERYFNTVFTPRERIEVRDGTGTNRLILFNNPVLAVRDLYIDGTQEDTANLHVYKGSGKIELGVDATSSVFKRKVKAITVKYIYGFLEESPTPTTTDAASVAGTSVALSVVSETNFTVGNWIEIYGMDGNKEAAQISATSTGEITVDQLVEAHESGSTVIELIISPNFTKLMNIFCSIAMVARIIGQSYTDIVGYNIGEMRVQKGEPYTQWRETALQLQREKDSLMKTIKIRPSVI